MATCSVVSGRPMLLRAIFLACSRLRSVTLPADAQLLEQNVAALADVEDMNFLSQYGHVFSTGRAADSRSALPTIAAHFELQKKRSRPFLSCRVTSLTGLSTADPQQTQSIVTVFIAPIITGGGAMSMKIGEGMWRWRESNPRVVMLPNRHLRVYLRFPALRQEGHSDH